MRLFSKAWSCFSLDTEKQYWTVTVQYWKKWIKFQWLAIFCLYTLPLARPAQVKIQMITTSSWTVKILLHINNFNYTWHMQNNLVKSNCPTSRNIQLLYENFLIIFIGLIGMLNWKKKVIWLAVLFKTLMKRFHLHPIWVILTFWLFWSFKLEERYCTHHAYVKLGDGRYFFWNMHVWKIIMKYNMYKKNRAKSMASNNGTF